MDLSYVGFDEWFFFAFSLTLFSVLNFSDFSFYSLLCEILLTFLYFLFFSNKSTKKLVARASWAVFITLFFHSKIFRLFFLFPDLNRFLSLVLNFFSNAKLGDFCSKSRRRLWTSRWGWEWIFFFNKRKFEILLQEISWDIATFPHKILSFNTF